MQRLIVQLTRMLLPFLPEAVAFALIDRLVGRRVPLDLKDRDRQALATAQRFEFGGKAARFGWGWGSGPLVVLVHGWGGRAAQMAPLAMHLASLGFRAIAFDALAHGESEGDRIRFRNFITDLVELNRHLRSEVFAYVAHSAGGLCVMSARRQSLIKAARYACICAPRAPYPPIRSIHQLFAPSPALLERCRKHFASQLAAGWDELDAAAAYEYSGEGRLMLVYDEDDARVDHCDGDKIQAQWPGSVLIKTQGLGHQKALWSKPVIQGVGEFLQAP